MMVLSRRLKKKVRKTLVFFCKVCKKTNHNAEKCWHKGMPQCNFCKKFGHVEKDCWHKRREQANFVKNGRKKGKKNFSLLLNLMQ